MDSEKLPQPARTLADVPSPEDFAAASMRRLRIEITDKFGTVKAFHEHIHGIGYEGLNDNLANRSDMRLGVFYECLAVLEMDQAEFARRVLRDLEDRRQ